MTELVDASQPFAHLILTRFNVRVGYSERMLSDPNWLAHRFDLFDSFCYPSVRGQTIQNFRWLVLFDEQTPTEFKERIERYAQWERFVPRFVGPFDERNLDFLVREYLSAQTRYVITSRIDNDDAFSYDYVQRVQDAFVYQHNTVINFINGLVLDLTRSRLYASQHNSNPFASLIEDCDNGRLTTVFGKEHNELPTLGPSRQLAGEPAWLVVIHDKNVSNRIGPARRLPIQKLRSQFSLAYTPPVNDSNLVVQAENIAYSLRSNAKRLSKVFRS